jgi:hypothetical protein
MDTCALDPSCMHHLPQYHWPVIEMMDRIAKRFLITDLSAKA